ncbi:MAG: HU family DNA-binding protein [Rhodobacteraceae bacterium]|nr:HU family DNA-binding protein [Paracoccaceae bacterium]
MATRSSSSRTTKGKSTTPTRDTAPDAPLRVVASAAPGSTDAAEAAPDDTPEADAETASGPSAYGRRELVARVVELTGARKRDARPVVEATLAAMAEVLAEGRPLNLPPLGKLSVNRSRAEGGVMMLKLRRPGLRKPADAPLAEADTDG